LKILYSILFILFLASCKSPDLAISDDLKSNSVAYDVSGRQGWMINQVISFGEFKTSKVKRGWTKSSSWDLPFFGRFNDASEKLEFKQFTPSGESAEIYTVAELSEHQIGLFDDAFKLRTHYENVFVGTVIINENNYWDFAVHTPEGNLSENKNFGYALSKNGVRIEIMGLTEIEGKSALINFANFGFEFISNGRVLGAVSLLNKGKVWLSKSLNKNEELVVSSLASALMLRSELENI
jgi:hypothetical protein